MGGRRPILEATIDLRRKLDAEVRILGHVMRESARPATLSHTKMSRFKNVTIQIITTNNDNIIIQKQRQIGLTYCHENTQHQNQNIPTKTQNRIDKIQKHNRKPKTENKILKIETSQFKI